MTFVGLSETSPYFHTSELHQNAIENLRHVPGYSDNMVISPEKLVNMFSNKKDLNEFVSHSCNLNVLAIAARRRLKPTKSRRLIAEPALLIGN